MLYPRVSFDSLPIGAIFIFLLPASEMNFYLCTCYLLQSLTLATPVTVSSGSFVHGISMTFECVSISSPYCLLLHVCVIIKPYQWFIFHSNCSLKNDSYSYVPMSTHFNYCILFSLKIQLSQFYPFCCWWRVNLFSGFATINILVPVSSYTYTFDIWKILAVTDRISQDVFNFTVKSKSFTKRLYKFIILPALSESSYFCTITHIFLILIIYWILIPFMDKCEEHLLFSTWSLIFYSLGIFKSGTGKIVWWIVLLLVYNEF